MTAKDTLADRFVRGDVIGAVEEAFVDLAARHDESISIVWLLSISIASSS
jgi:hypothetical protein